MKGGTQQQQLCKTCADTPTELERQAKIANSRPDWQRGESPRRSWNPAQKETTFAEVKTTLPRARTEEARDTAMQTDPAKQRKYTPANGRETGSDTTAGSQQLPQQHVMQEAPTKATLEQPMQTGSNSAEPLKQSRQLTATTTSVASSLHCTVRVCVPPAPHGCEQADLHAKPAPNRGIRSV